MNLKFKYCGLSANKIFLLQIERPNTCFSRPEKKVKIRTLKKNH